MWNASDESWPGGFTRGIPLTAQIVLDTVRKKRVLAFLVALESDRIVGVVELTEFEGDAHAAYVSLLNVVPTHQAKGHGKELLKKCVDIATQKGYDSLHLFTWPGNLKAIPLYKKAGFFWIPKTTVHMKNYVPFIRNLEVVSPFFKRYDWYKSLKRELEVKEDEYSGLLPYLWEENGDMLSVAIDAESGGVAAFENNEFSVSQKVEKSFIGKKTNVRWRLKNKINDPLCVNLISRGEKGITLNQRESVLLTGECELEGEAFVETDTVSRGEKEPPYLLTTEVVINGVSLSLVSGLRVQHMVEITTDPEHLFLSPGERSVTVILCNNGDERAEGHVLLENTGELHSFSIPPHYREAIPFTVYAERDGNLRFSVDGVTHIIPMCVTQGAGVIQRENSVILENAHARIIVSLLGGETSIFPQKMRGKRPFTKYMNDQVGPPFSPSRISLSRYRARTYHSGGKAVAELTVRVEEQGIELVRKIEMDSTPLVSLSYTIIPHKDVLIRVVGETPMDGGVLTVPLREGIVSAHTMEDAYPLQYEDVPSRPSEYKEPWMCYEREGLAFGVIWDECTEIDVDSHGILNVSLSPETEKEMERHLYLYCGRGSWRDVQEACARIHGTVIEEEEPLRLWDIAPSVILSVDDTLTCLITLESHRGKPMNGFIDGNAFGVKRGSPFTFTKTCEPLYLGVNKPVVKMETDLFTKEIPLSVVRVGEGGDISVKEGDVVTVDNGMYQFRVAPHFCGALVFFGRDCNHLLTSYPEVTQFSFFNPWYGGIHPVIFLEDFPGRIWKEQFTYRLVDCEWYDISWKGVTVMCECEEVKGARLETSYLTTGRSNLLVVMSRAVNMTSAPLSFTYGVLIYLSPDGMRETTLYYNDEELQERRRTPYGGVTGFHDWAAVKGGNTYLTVVGKDMDIFDMGCHGAHIHAIQEVTLTPRGTASSLVWVAALGSLKASSEYRVLKKVQWKSDL